MRTFNVYRTDKGNLTFRVNDEPIYIIHAKNHEHAKLSLEQLRKDDKLFRKQNK